MRISIVIITSGREELLINCLNSVDKELAHLDNSVFIELIVVFNGCKKYDLKPFKLLRPQFLSLAKCYPSSARNQALLKCNGNYILFLDDDIKLCSGYLKKSLNFIAEYEPDIFGGSDKVYSNSDLFEESINLALQSPLATAQTRQRHSLSDGDHFNATEKHLTLSNLWIKKSLFQSGLLFHSEFKRNEENILISHVCKTSKRVFFLPKICVEHRRRNKLKNFFYPSFYSGYYRIKTFFRFHDQFEFIFILPLIAILAAPILLLIANKVLLILLSLYASLLLYFTFKISFKERRHQTFIPLLFLQPTILTSYALGSLTSLVVQLWRLLTQRGNSLGTKQHETTI